MTSYEKMLGLMAEMKVIDAHEHLPPEHERVSSEVDVFTLFSHYTKCDLGSAGMSEDDKMRLQDKDISLEQRWKKIEPYWNKTKHTSYSRAVRIVIKHFFGFTDLDVSNYREISSALKDMNKPGLYERIFRKECNITKVLNQKYISEKKDRLFKTVFHHGQNPLWYLQNMEELEKVESEFNISLRSYEGICNFVTSYCKELVKEQGVVGFKLPGCDFKFPQANEVNSMLRRLHTNGRIYESDQFQLQGCIAHTAIEASIKLEVPVAVHVGLTWDNWIDFYPLKVSNVVPWLLKYRDAKFDLYHMGIPWHDELLIIGKIYPNAWLNFCWCHIVSQRLSVELLSRALDIVPFNKIIGFGGDYNFPVEKVYGHLQMAKEDIAQALSKRIEEEKMDYEQAIGIAQDWLYDNPVNLYCLG